MATTVPQTPARPESFAGDLAGMFNFLIDPKGAAPFLYRKWFFVAPLLIACVAWVAYMVVSGPLQQHYMETSPIPANMQPEQYAAQLRATAAIMKVMPFAIPVITVVMTVIQAALLLATSSMLAVPARFAQLFNLVAGCSLISALQSFAWVIILTMKHGISSIAELKPPLGLDIFLPEGTNKFVMATFSYFSIFTIWAMVMTVLIYSIGFRTSKGKAATAVVPIYLLWFLFTLVGAAFQPK